MTALSSESQVQHVFSKKSIRFWKMDKNKCPKLKTKFTFWKKCWIQYILFLNLLKEKSKKLR